jgi:hypothetical protein
VLRLFVDPASISSGWALFDDAQFVKSGSVCADVKDTIFRRLKFVYKSYRALRGRAGEVHIEQLPRRCHIYTHWSVSVIGLALWSFRCGVVADVPVRSWQRFADWHGAKAPLEAYKGRVASEDELAAIGMGLWWVSTKL